MESTVGTSEEQTLEEAPFHVVGDNIIVEFVERVNVTDSGIYIPEDVQKPRPPDVVVVGIGDAAAEQCAADFGIDVEFGTTLIIRKHELLTLELGDDKRELHVVKPRSIIGIVAGDE